MPFQPFTHAEVVAILRLSEGTKVDDGHEGHAGRKHVNLPNDELGGRPLEGSRQRRKEQKGGKLALFTSFLNFEDQAQALLQVLNGADQSAALDAFLTQTRPGGPLTIEHARIGAPVRMRYALGGGASVFPCTMFTLWGRKELTRPRGLHVVSFFGTMGEMV